MPGGQGLSWLKTYQEQLGLNEGIYDLVFDNFWDLYMLKSQVEGLSPKKLQIWI